ncbi:MAG: hypothetical protein LBN97_02430 [Oscillospiraceae bacterium]|jgi:hypothetical protein|nr:hypothetical protein [Oscillospiraceae bacterium]
MTAELLKTPEIYTPDIHAANEGLVINGKAYAIPEAMLNTKRGANGYTIMPVEDEDDLYWPEYDDAE